MFNETLEHYILMIPILLISLTFHEFSHGYVAYRLGDITAKNAGRLTLNPFKHLDPVGTLMMLFAGFGWAKPVPVDPFYFRDKKKGMMLVSVAGPLSNILLAFVIVFPLEILIATSYNDIQNGATVAYYLFAFLRLLFLINLNLAIFNLIPVPPLDGSRILTAVLPLNAYFHFMKYERYTGLIFMLIIIVFPNALGSVMGYFTQPVATSMMWVAEKVIGIFIR